MMLLLLMLLLLLLLSIAVRNRPVALGPRFESTTPRVSSNLPLPLPFPLPSSHRCPPHFGTALTHVVAPQETPPKAPMSGSACHHRTHFGTPFTHSVAP